MLLLRFSQQQADEPAQSHRKSALRLLCRVIGRVIRRARWAAQNAY